jgi:head-tail adaptor
MISDYYTQTVNRLAFTSSTGDQFDTDTGSWANTDTFVAAVNLLSGQGRYIAGQPDVLADYKIFCDKTTIAFDDKLEWNGEQFRVVQEPKNTLQRNHHALIYVRRDGVSS